MDQNQIVSNCLNLLHLLKCRAELDKAISVIKEELQKTNNYEALLLQIYKELDKEKCF